MSLHTLANHLQSAGRGEDKQLVHMTPGEVEGLQAIAMAHGGSLTINPETGLPEAGFLSSILPMIAGFALGPAGLGLTAMQAGLASAAIGTVATGSLKQGVMAGLGAYGGAGMGQGLMAQGAPAVAPANTLPASVSANTTSTLGGNNLFGKVGAVDVAANPLQGGMTGFQASVPSVSPTAQGLTSATLNQTPLYPQVNFASGMTPPPTVGAGQGVFNPAASSANYMNPVRPGADLSPSLRNTMTMNEAPMREAYSALNPAPMPQMPPGATGYAFDPLKGGYNYYGPGGNPVMPPSAAASGYTPSTATTSQQFAGGIQGQGGIPSGATNVSGQGINRPFSERMSQLGQGAKTSFSSTEGLKGLYNAMPTGSVAASGLTLAEAMKPEYKEPAKDKSLIRPYEFTYGATGVDQEPYSGSAERLYFNPQFTALTPYEAPGPEYKRAANGGLMASAVGGPVEQMSAMNSVGANTGYPMANIDTPLYSNPMMQRPEATNVLAPSVDAGVGTYTGEAKLAAGGISHLGDYSDGGRLLKGPGDGVSDSIPASIGNRQPARLADGEFVVPARIVSEIGNGSTEAGARKLYAMMDRVQKARRATVGKDQVARNTKAEKLLPA